MERRLAAVLAADVVDYSQLMGEDETGTLKRLTSLRQKLLEPLIGKHRGRVVKLMGDGFLVEFPSVVDAVECAVAWQQVVAENEAHQPEDSRFLFRIGINIGDVLVEGEDIHGDGVNVASRLESLADPAGVCISGPAFDQLRNKLGLGYEFLGEQQVKNIQHAVRVYRVLTDPAEPGQIIGEDAPSNSIRKWAVGIAAVVLVVLAGVLAWYGPWTRGVEPMSTEDNAYPLPDKPSIAVLPFSSLFEDQSQEYFADGITNDVITSLSKFRSLFVIASNSSFHYKGKSVKVQDVGRELGVRYVLEGSVQRTGDKVRINAQLVEAATGHHVWAENYDRGAQDLFAVQKEITRNIVGIIGSSVLLKAEIDRLTRAPTESLEAYDFYLRGELHSGRETKEDNLLARQFYEKSFQIDPDYALAVAAISQSYLAEIWGSWFVSREQSLQQAERFALRSIELDDAQPWGYRSLGYVHQFQGEIEQAIAMWEKAYALNPNDFFTMRGLGYGLAYTGDPQKGLPIMEEAMRVNPHHGEGQLRTLGQVYFLARRYQEAVDTLQKITRRHRTSFWLYLAASYAQLDRIDDAQAAITEALKLKPELSLDHEIKRREENGLSAENAMHLREALVKAGLPE
jgi:adenylate cyclase